jgi:hypothetical protein
MTSNSDLPDTGSSFSAGVDETVVARARNFVPELRRRSARLRNPGQLRRAERYRQTTPLKGVKIGRR